MRKFYAWLGAMAMILGLGLLAPGPASAAPYCGIYWGSAAEASAGSTSAPITNVRAGRHTCFDRMVIDIRGQHAGYTVKYVNAVRSGGSGQVVRLRGGADLAVVVDAPTYNRNGNAVYRPSNRKELVNVSNFRTFRQIAMGSSFEGTTTFGLGVRARLPFRTFTVNDAVGGSRLVIDVAHRW